MATQAAHQLRVQVNMRLHHGTDEFGEEKKPADAAEALQWLCAVLDKVEELLSGRSPQLKAKVKLRKLSSSNRPGDRHVGVIVEMRKTLDSASPDRRGGGGSPRVQAGSPGAGRETVPHIYRAAGVDSVPGLPARQVAFTLIIKEARLPTVARHHSVLLRQGCR